MKSYLFKTILLTAISLLIQGCVVADMAQFYADPIGHCMGQDSNKVSWPDDKVRKQKCIEIENEYNAIMANAKAPKNQTNDGYRSDYKAIQLPDDSKVFGGSSSSKASKLKK